MTKLQNIDIFNAQTGSLHVAGEVTAALKFAKVLTKLL